MNNPALNYISADAFVQGVFVIAVAVVLLFLVVIHRIERADAKQRAQEQDEKNFQRLRDALKDKK